MTLKQEPRVQTGNPDMAEERPAPIPGKKDPESRKMMGRCLLFRLAAIVCGILSVVYTFRISGILRMALFTAAVILFWGFGGYYEILSCAPVSIATWEARRQRLEKRKKRLERWQGRIVPAMMMIAAVLAFNLSIVMAKEIRSHFGILILMAVTALFVSGWILFRRNRGKAGRLDRWAQGKMNQLMEAMKKTPVTGVRNGLPPSVRSPQQGSGNVPTSVFSGVPGSGGAGSVFTGRKSAGTRPAASTTAPSRSTKPAAPTTAPSLSVNSRPESYARTRADEREMELKNLLHTYDQQRKNWRGDPEDWKGQHIFEHRELHHAAVSLFPGSFLMQTREGMIQMLVWAGQVLPCIRDVVQTRTGQALLAEGGAFQPETAGPALTAEMECLVAPQTEKEILSPWKKLDPETMMAGWEALQCFAGQAEAPRLRYWTERLAQELETREDTMDRILAIHQKEQAGETT